MLTRWNDAARTFAVLEEVQRWMDRGFEMDNRLPAAPGYGDSTWPRVNLDDVGTSLVITAEVPGLAPDDLQVNVNHEVLTITGARFVEAPKGYSTHRQERPTARFARSFALPCKLDPEKVSAIVKHGLLTITMEKVPEAQPRQISVKSS